MKRINFTLFFFCAAFIIGCSERTFAQQEIATEKRNLIQELRDLTGLKKLGVKTGFTSTNIGEVLISIIEKDKELTEAQKQELKKTVVEAQNRLEKQIRDFSEDTTISTQLSEEVSFQLFDNNFTESELREMVVFYRTPTGQKSLKFFSGYTKQLEKAFTEAYSKKLQDFLGAKLQAEIDWLKEKIKELKDKKLEA